MDFYLFLTCFASFIGVATAACGGITSACENGSPCVGNVCDCSDIGFRGDQCEIPVSFDFASTHNDGDEVEEGDSVRFTIMRSILGYEITLTGTVTGTGQDNDVSFVGDLAFEAGEQAQVVDVVIVDDDIFEQSETITVVFEVVDDSIIFSTGITLTIKESDPLNVTSTNPSPRFSEDVGSFTLSFLSINPSSIALTIIVSATGNSAVQDVDYLMPTGLSSITYNDVAQVSTFAIEVINDGNPEPDKTLSISIRSSQTLLGTTDFDITIEDDDDEVITLTGPSSVQEDGNVATYVLTRQTAFHDAELSLSAISNRALSSSLSKKMTEINDKTISFTAGGTTTESITVNLLNDEKRETDQSFDITVTVVSGRISPIGKKTVTVVEDDGYGVSISDGTVSEGDTFSMTFTRDSTVGQLDISVTSTDGTALAGTHYTAVNQLVTFVDGEAERTIDIATMEDDLFGANVQFTVTVTSFSPLKTVTPATVTIENDDTYSMSISDVEVTEGSSATVDFTRDSTVGQLVINIVTVDGTALAGGDYTAVTTTKTFAEGEKTVSVDIQTTSDTQYEPDETLQVQASASDVNPSTVPGTITITNDDAEVLTLSVAETVSESAGSLTCTLTRTASFESLTVNITTLIPDVLSPIDDSDISMLTADDQTFESGETSLDFSIAITDDSIPEPKESFTISVAAPEPIESVSATVEIVSDDPDEISLDTFLGSVENVGSKVVTLKRKVTDNAMTVQIEADDVTAKEGTDFTVPSEATFETGQLTTTFSVTIQDDTDEEGEETFTIRIYGNDDEVGNEINDEFRIADNEGSYPFDCRRPNQSCPLPTDICLPDFPYCLCVGLPEREGGMCNIIIDQKDKPECNLNCNEHGVCLSDSGTLSCACFPGYFGDKCENYFLKAECSSASLSLIANPHGDFGGLIYVDGRVGESSCRAVSSDDGFEVEVAHDSETCGSISPVEGETETTYSRKFIIQYDSMILTQLDQCVLVICKFDKDNVLVDMGIVTLENATLTKESIKDDFLPVSVVIVDDVGDPVTESMVIPISEKLCVTLTIPQAFGALEMIDIEFNNSKEDEPQKLLVFEEGCKTPRSLFIFSAIPYYVSLPNKRVMRFCFFAFKFSKSSKLTAQMKVKICLDPDKCSLKSCGARKKREIETGTRTTTIGTTFTISYPDQQNGESPDNTGTGTGIVDTEQTCSYPKYFLPAIIGMASLVLVMIIIILYLTYRIARRPNNKLRAQKTPSFALKYPAYFTHR